MVAQDAASFPLARSVSRTSVTTVGGNVRVNCTIVGGQGGAEGAE